MLIINFIFLYQLFSSFVKLFFLICYSLRNKIRKKKKQSQKKKCQKLLK
jgi:hypothetical protein